MKKLDKNISIMYAILLSLLCIPFILISTGSLGTIGSSILPWEILIIGIIKLSVVGFFCIYIFRLFLKQEKHFFTDAKHLFAWQFLFIFVGKSYDIWLVLLSNGDLYLLEINPEFLIFLKIRWIIIILTVAPTLFFFIHIYSKIWTQKMNLKGTIFAGEGTIEQLEKYQKRLEVIIDISYLVLWVILSIITKSYLILKVLTPVIVFPIIFMGIITFNGLRKNQRLPQLNSAYMMFGYIIYFCSEILRAILIGFEFTMILEMTSTIGFFLNGISFIIPPKYSIVKPKPVLS